MKKTIALLLITTSIVPSAFGRSAMEDLEIYDQYLQRALVAHDEANTLKYGQALGLLILSGHVDALEADGHPAFDEHALPGIIATPEGAGGFRKQAADVDESQRIYKAIEDLAVAVTINADLATFVEPLMNAPQDAIEAGVKRIAGQSPNGANEVQIARHLELGKQHFEASLNTAKNTSLHALIAASAQANQYDLSPYVGKVLVWQAEPLVGGGNIQQAAQYLQQYHGWIETFVVDNADVGKQLQGFSPPFVIEDISQPVVKLHGANPPAKTPKEESYEAYQQRVKAELVENLKKVPTALKDTAAQMLTTNDAKKYQDVIGNFTNNNIAEAIAGLYKKATEKKDAVAFEVLSTLENDGNINDYLNGITGSWNAVKSGLYYDCIEKPILESLMRQAFGDEKVYRDLLKYAEDSEKIQYINRFLRESGRDEGIGQNSWASYKEFLDYKWMLESAKKLFPIWRLKGMKSYDYTGQNAFYALDDLSKTAVGKKVLEDYLDKNISSGDPLYGNLHGKTWEKAKTIMGNHIVQ